MCGAISGFHALVSSGTTPKMIRKESDARTIGYGAMLVEALVGVVAMIAAATLPVGDYYAMNVDLAQVPAYHDRILSIPGGGVEHIGQYEELTQESLRGRTGGAVTLAVGMAHIFDDAAGRIWTRRKRALRSMWKYWYHFAIMFEALFILTTIDTGTRIGRFVLAGGRRQMGASQAWRNRVVARGDRQHADHRGGVGLLPQRQLDGRDLAHVRRRQSDAGGHCPGGHQRLSRERGEGAATSGSARCRCWSSPTTTMTAAAEMLSGLLDGLAAQWNN